MISLRSFLVIGTLSAIVLTSFISAVQGYNDTLRKANQLFDQQMADFSALLVRATKDRREISEISSLHINRLFRIWKEDKTIVAQSKILKGELPVRNKEEAFFETIANHRWRVIVRHYRAQNAWVLVAERADIRQQLAEQIALASITPMVSSVPIIGIILWIVISLGLRPIQNLSEQIIMRQAQNLSPIALDSVPNELHELTASVNDLLSRLETTIEREKAFAGDAAHELRTPLALLKIELENAKANYDDPLLFSGIEQGVDRLGHLVEQILILHRHSPEMLMNDFEAMELGAITREVIAENYQLIENKQQHLELVASNNPAYIEGNRFAIRAMISNLLSNAIKYTPEGGQIRLTIESDLLKTLLKVEDSGTGIPEDKRDRVFDRFVRIHSATTNKVYGAGLGLAIVKQAAQLHDAKIAIENSAFSSGTCFRVEFSTFHMTEEAQ